MEIILFLIALFATTLGSLAGLGGGIIIKPILDLLHMDVLTVGMLSSLTVLSMAVVSSAKHLHAKRVGMRILYLGIGASVGGFIGNFLLLGMATDPIYLQKLQSAALAVILAVILILMRLKSKIKPMHITSRTTSIIVGLLLGIISSFLGIGGGPLNVIVLFLMFGLNAKDAAASSVFIIMFAQVTKLFFITGDFDVSYLYYMIPGGVIGGFLGAFYNKRISERAVTITFNVMIFMMILLNLYNYGLF